MAELSTTDKVLKGGSTQTVITIMSGVIEILAFSIMSRLLTQQDFGYYAAITAVSTIFASFSDAGIGSAIVQRKKLNQDYIDNAFTLSLLFGIFGSSLLLICSGPIATYVADKSMQTPLMLVAITLLTNTIASVNFSIMQRKLQFLRMGVIRILALIITTIVSIALALKGFGYYAIIAKVILYSLITMTVSFFATNTRFHFSFNYSVYKEIFGFGGWLMASAFFRKIAEQIDRLVMSSLFSVSTLGLYSRPKDFINTMTGKFCDIFDSTLFPVLTPIQDDELRLSNTYQSALYYLNLLGMIVTLAFLFNSELLIRIFLGSEWLNVNYLFKLLSFSAILMINGSIGDIFLRALALTKQQFYLRILQSLSAVLLILAAAKAGILAVAGAYLAAYALVVIVKMVYLSKKINLGLKDSIFTIVKSFKVSIVFLPMYILCRYNLPNNLYGSICKMVIFIILFFITFFLIPNVVGKKYKEEIYNRIISVVKK